MRRADYEYNKLPDAKERSAIGQAVGLSARAVQVWFQNRRQRQKPAGGTKGPPATQWVEMEASKRVQYDFPHFNAQSNANARAHAVQLHGMTKSDESPKAADAAGHTQPRLPDYAMPDPERAERERALSKAVTQARIMQERGSARDIALGYSPKPKSDSPPAPAISRTPMLSETPSTPSVFNQSRMDPTQLLSLDAQANRLELRAALLDAYSNPLPGLLPRSLADLQGVHQNGLQPNDLQATLNQRLAQLKAQLPPTLAGFSNANLTSASDMAGLLTGQWPFAAMHSSSNADQSIA